MTEDEPVLSPPVYPGSVTLGPDGPKLIRVGAVKMLVLIRDRWTCQHCGTFFPPMTNAKGEPIPVLLNHQKGLTIDHIVPKSKGGRSTYDNMWCLCWPCHVWKTEVFDNIGDRHRRYEDGQGNPIPRLTREGKPCRHIEVTGLGDGCRRCDFCHRVLRPKFGWPDGVSGVHFGHETGNLLDPEETVEAQKRAMDERAVKMGLTKPTDKKPSRVAMADPQDRYRDA